MLWLSKTILWSVKVDIPIHRSSSLVVILIGPLVDCREEGLSDGTATGTAAGRIGRRVWTAAGKNERVTGTAVGRRV